jgi:lauroyl/myristoyl acyltransferase/acyl carrier protein
MCQVLLPMAVGGSTVLLPAADWLGEPGLLFAAVEEHGGTHTYMPAFGFRRCVDRVAPDATYDLSSWRNVNCAGEPVPPGVLPAFEERCRPWGLRPGAVSVAYGMAEVVAGATIAPLGGGYAVDTVSASTLLADGRATPSHRGRRFVSCGPPIDCLEGAVVDHDGRPLAERDVGEIALRGPTLGAVLTDDGTRPLPTTSDGWFRTGDIGYLADGEVHVVDRARDLIIVGGVNLHPSRIEQAALDAVPAVRRSAAFGVMDLTTGTEQPVLLLERPRDPLDESAALRKVRRALLGIGVAVRDVAFVDRGTIAMTTSGKVRRRATRESYLAAAPTASAAGPRDWLEVVRDVTGVEAVHVDTTLDDLRVDSLALLELVTALETLLDVEVDLDELRPVATLGDLGRVLGIGREPPSGRSLDGPRTPVASSPPCNRLRRRIRLGPVLGPVHLPLRLGIQAHVFAASLRLRFGGGASALVPVVELAEAVGADVDDVARISLLTNTWTAWRQAAAPAELRRVMTRPTDRRKAPLRVVGGDHLTEAVAVGRGVILLALHQSVAPILQAFPALDGLSFRPFDARATTSVERAWQLREAHETLRRGGVVMILADEFIGTGGITVEIAGKDRPLRPGFARLAVATEAEVVPAFGSYDTAGRLTIDLRAPMSGATEDELLADYGSMLRTFWHEHPGSLTWNIVRRHRTFDRAPSGGALQEVGP